MIADAASVGHSRRSPQGDRLIAVAGTILETGSRLVRIVGEPESGRTGLALSLCLPDVAGREGTLLLVDTLGHGPPKGLDPDVDLVHLAAVDVEEAFFAVRRLLSTRAVSAVILDDVLGFDVLAGDGSAKLQRLRLIQARIQALASLCLGRSTKLVVLDRLSPMGIQRSPLGFTDIVLSPDLGGLSRSPAA